MEFIDLKTQYLKIKQEINQAIKDVFVSGQFILDQQVANFESKIANYLNVKYALGVASGTDALLLSLLALDIDHNDEVIAAPFSFISSANVISRIGAKPVFVDINPRTFNIDAGQLETKITPRTKAIIPVHLFGQMADMPAIMRIAKKHHLFVIEDACQALGASYKNKKAGSFGHLACFSFFPTKNLGAYGDAGLVATNNAKLSEKIRLLRAHGAQEKYYHPILGLNSRLDELQAAILNTKFKYLDYWNQKRIQHAQMYSCQLNSLATIPFRQKNYKHIFHHYTIRTKLRDPLQAHLSKNSIPTIVYYPLPLHLQACFKYLGYRKGDFPEAEKASQEVLSLPIYPELTQKQQKRIIQKIISFFNKIY